MRLNVTSESDTYVYATSPINFGGVSKEDLLFWMVPMAAVKQLSDDSLLGFAVGCFTLWLYKKATSDKPEGYLVLAISVWVGNGEQSDLAKRIPFIGRVLRNLNRLLATIWLEVGSLPSPQFCNRYEP